MYQTKLGAVTLIATITFLAACQNGGEQATEQRQTEEKTAVTSEEVKQETQEALATAQQYARQQKEVYQQQMQRQLEELNTQMAALKEQAEQVGEQTRKDLQKLRQDIQQKEETAQKKLADLQSANVETWKEMKAAVDAAMQDLQKSYDEFRSRSSEEQSAQQRRNDREEHLRVG